MKSDGFGILVGDMPAAELWGRRTCYAAKPGVE